MTPSGAGIPLTPTCNCLQALSSQTVNIYQAIILGCDIPSLYCPPRRQSILKYHLTNIPQLDLRRLKITSDDDATDGGEMVDKYLINLIHLPCVRLESAIL